MEKENLTFKIRKNPWIASTIFLGLVCLIFIFSSFDASINGFDEVEVCKSISGTPSWTDDSGNVVASGYTNFNNQSIDIVNIFLIPDRIHFIYSNDCGWCKKQIEYFGATWQDYLDSGLTHDCGEIIK